MYKFAFLVAIVSLQLAQGFAVQVIPQAGGVCSQMGSGFGQGLSGLYQQSQQYNYYQEEQMEMMRQQVRMQQEALRLMKYGY